MMFKYEINYWDASVGRFNTNRGICAAGDYPSACKRIADYYTGGCEFNMTCLKVWEVGDCGILDELDEMGCNNECE